MYPFSIRSVMLIMGWVSLLSFRRPCVELWTGLLTGVDCIALGRSCPTVCGMQWAVIMLL